MTERQSPEKIAEAVVAHMYAHDRMAQALGVDVDAAGPGSAVLRMTVRDDMLNSQAIAHGGATFALADVAFSYACNAYNRIALAAHCAITYLRAVSPGDVLTASAAEVSRSGRNGVYDVTVTDGNGAVVALFRGTSREVKGAVVPGLAASP